MGFKQRPHGRFLKHRLRQAQGPLNCWKTVANKQMELIMETIRRDRAGEPASRRWQSRWKGEKRSQRTGFSMFWLCILWTQVPGFATCA